MCTNSKHQASPWEGGRGLGTRLFYMTVQVREACMQFEQRWYTAFCKFHSYTLYTVHTQAYASTHINCSFLLQLLRACTKHHAHVCRCQWLVLSFRQFPLLAMTNGLSTWHMLLYNLHHMPPPGLSFEMNKTLNVYSLHTSLTQLATHSVQLYAQDL